MNNDLEVIRELEQELGISFSGNRDDSGPYAWFEAIDDKIISLSITRKKIKNFKKIISIIQKLKELESLRITDCDVKSINGIKRLIQLKELDLNSNNIEIVSELSYLINITRLVLYSNEIEDIHPISALLMLDNLVLFNNRIIDINPLKNLTSLTHLYLNNNKIETIDAIQYLPHLKLLWLNDNFIQQLPEWIVENQYPEIDWDAKTVMAVTDLFGNPLPQEIISAIQSGGKKALKRYFERLKTQGVDHIYEAKVILVGDGSAGKTSLQKRILRPNAALPKKEDRTRGIQISDWTFKKEKGKKAIAHMWDFGGQDVYYPVHRFFLTENAVFCLLASSRQPQHNFDYWVPTIRQFSGRSPIILAQTCVDGQRATTWTDVRYYLNNTEHFNIIKTTEKGYIELNLPNDNEGLEAMRQAIIGQITALPHYSKAVPKSYIPVREAILEEKNPCISYERFSEICRAADAAAFAQDVDVEDCARLFHSIGVVLWYEKNNTLKDWVVLQPGWAMNAVYCIIDDMQIGTQKGVITQADFTRLWGAAEYKTRHAVLKQMLQVFKIAFERKQPKGQYVLPVRLDPLPDDARWGKDNKEYLRLEYQFDFMPRGIVNGLSADLSAHIRLGANKVEEVWSNAVNLEYESGAICQVEEDIFNRKIKILATGNDARGLVILVMATLKNILEDYVTDDYRAGEPEINVPCICTHCKNNEKPTLFPYKKLLEWSKTGDTVACNEGRETLNIDRLLRHVGLPNTVKEPLLRALGQKTIQIFLASSEELAEERKEFQNFISTENDYYQEQGITLKLVKWENSFIDAMSRDGLQEVYNKAVDESDIFVSLFFTKVGKYTEEEFERAFAKFTKTDKPFIYTYFKSGKVDIDKLGQEYNTRLAFEKKLKELKHYKSKFKNTEDLHLNFKRQLERIIPKLNEK